MKNSKKLDKIDSLTLDLNMLFDVLIQSLRCIEYDEGRNCEQIYLCRIIEKKLNKIRNLF